MVEVGPGVGSLTIALLDAGANVCAIELDRHVIPVLEEVTHGRDVAIMHADDSDQEVCALKSNPEFMAYFTECHQRADSEPRFSLEQLREMYGLPLSTSAGPSS